MNRAWVKKRRTAFSGLRVIFFQGTKEVTQKQLRDTLALHVGGSSASAGAVAGGFPAAAAGVPRPQGNAAGPAAANGPPGPRPGFAPGAAAPPGGSAPQAPGFAGVNGAGAGGPPGGGQQHLPHNKFLQASLM